MKINLVMATATATAMTALMTAPAMAANLNYLSQTGNFNDAVVDQSVGDSNRSGTDLDPVSQDGDYNDLSITQSDGSSLGQSGTGVDQFEDRNRLTITQVQSRTQQVTQTSVAGVSAVTNLLTISQVTGAGYNDGSNFYGSTIGTVVQTYTGNGTQNRNEAAISQTASAGSHPHSVVAFSQVGTANEADVTQTGGRQILQQFRQNGNGNEASVLMAGYWNTSQGVEQDGNNNRLDLSLTGVTNGGVGDLKIYARPYSHDRFNSAVRQLGDDNRASLTITGDNNGFAIFQDGNSNHALGLEIVGALNDLAIGQYFGNFNTILLDPITGNNNSVALRQGVRPTGSGDNNEIDGSILGSNNVAIVDQVGSNNDTTFNQSGGSNTLNVLAFGDGNVVDADQFGGSNVADVDVTGNGNALDILQNQTGGLTNEMTVVVTGHNNNTSPAPSISGDAATARLAARTALGDPTFNRGDLVQDGTDNSLDLSVLSSNNAFAAAQIGNGNTIEHNISIGNSNQAVITQVGNNHVSVTSQIGSNNNLGVIQ